MAEIKVLDMKVIGRYAGGQARYKFHRPFPDGSLRTLDKGHLKKEDAYQEGKDWVKKYQWDYFPGGMGEVLGVEEKDGLYHAVINTYYSRS